MLIQVTDAHINVGEGDDPERCAIALAVREAFPYVEHVYVGHTGVTVGMGPDAEYYNLPDEAQEFIQDFDAWGTGVPFSFELQPVTL